MRTCIYSGVGEGGARLPATISRTLNSFEQKDIDKFNDILEHLYKMTHKPSSKEHIILDLDSTNIKTHGHQDESTYIYHYGTTGYHPMVLYDGLTGDLMSLCSEKEVSIPPLVW